MQAHRIVGAHPVVRAIADTAERLARSGAAVALVGERGTGKELLARWLHAAGGRPEERCLRIDGAEPSVERLEHELFTHDGGWRRARGGTLLLDDLASLPLDLQLRLRDDLRAADQCPQVVATLHDELAAAARAGRLAEPLIELLRPIEVVLPALRQRRADIPLLVDHFLAVYGERHGVGLRSVEPEALVRLWQYDWPGNVRELESVIERVVVLCARRAVRLGDLPAEVRSATSARPVAPPLSAAITYPGPHLRPTF